MSMTNWTLTCAATLLALAAMTAGAQAYQCKSSYVQAEALGAQKGQATRRARTFWSQAVTEKYDVAWSVWKIAAAKSTNCNWTGTKYYCIVKAKPCLNVIP